MSHRVPFLPWCKVRNPEGGQRKVSDNYRFYSAKMAELRVYRAASRPLHDQLHELLVFVRMCEALWR
jgi:hypothetical protein